MDTAGNLPCMLLLALLFLSFILFLRSEWEKKQLKTELYEIVTEKIRKKTRFVFLSDLHSVSFGADNQKLLERIYALSPDAVLIGGDMITCGRKSPQPPKTDACLHFLSELSAQYPVYFAEGNHEVRFAARFPDAFQMFRDHLLQLGISYIRDGVEVFDTERLIENDEDDVAIYGISMDQKYFHSMTPGFGRREPLSGAYLEQKLMKPDRSRFSILLMHSPLYLKEAADWGADLVLSGHFHGGTVRIPFLGGLMTPQYQFFVKECAGRFHFGSTEMIVSRGLGTHSVRVRLNDLPELSVIDLVPGLPEKQ